MVRMRVPARREILAALREGRQVFVGTAAISLYTASNVFILGLIASTTAVGYFSAAEKLVRAVQQLLNPVSQSIYPYVNALAARSREEALEFIRKILRWVGSGAFLASASLFVLAGPLATLVLGSQYTSSIELVRWMAFVPWIITLSNVFGIQTMLTFGMGRAFSTIIVLAGLFNVFLAIPLDHLMQAKGAAISVLVTEAIIMMSMATVLYSRGFNIFASGKGL
jgi:PST family polysaccharide transporter